MSLLIQNTQVQKALEQLATAAPNGYTTLATLDDTVIADILTWPDTVKVVWPNKFMMVLPGVDENGYTVYDKFMQIDHTVVVDGNDPGLALTAGLSRNMTFGITIEDMNFMWQRQHGDVFYIGYGCGEVMRRTLMFLVLDPLFPTGS